MTTDIDATIGAARLDLALLLEALAKKRIVPHLDGIRGERNESLALSRLRSRCLAQFASSACGIVATPDKVDETAEAGLDRRAIVLVLQARSGQCDARDGEQADEGVAAGYVR